MSGPGPAVAATRVAVRELLAEQSGDLPGRRLLVACSGGPDSLALAAAAAFEAPRAGWSPGAVVVDHGLQRGSDLVARQAGRACAAMGLDPVRIVRAHLPASADASPEGGGPEALARAARYAALEQVAADCSAGLVLLAHTRDDQAEQVLLGLMRGSGTRSLSGMPRRRGVFARPLLGVPAATTRAACAELGLTPWHDPHNDDPRFARVRVRRLLARAETDLGPGVSAALARSAMLLRADADALDAQAGQAVSRLGAGPWQVQDLAALNPAVRGRVWRLLAQRAGVPAGALGQGHVAAADRLITRWSGQGPVHLPGAFTVWRSGAAIVLAAPAGPGEPASGPVPRA